MTDDLAQARRKRTVKLSRSLQVLIHEIPDEEGGCEHVGDDDVFLCWACRDVIYQREIESALLAHEREVLERAAQVAEALCERWRNENRWAPGRPSTGALGALLIATAVRALSGEVKS